MYVLSKTTFNVSFSAVTNIAIRFRCDNKLLYQVMYCADGGEVGERMVIGTLVCLS